LFQKENRSRRGRNWLVIGGRYGEREKRTVTGKLRKPLDQATISAQQNFTGLYVSDAEKAPLEEAARDHDNILWKDDPFQVQ
jgi:hypothetical protein